MNDTWDGDQAYRDWSYAISRNPNAIHLIEKNLDKISWTEVSTNPNAISLLEKYPDSPEIEKINSFLTQLKIRMKIS